jgi:hypothetical protein
MVLSAALSNIEVEYVDGVIGKDVLDKAIPATPGHNRMPDPVIGCWRAHMDAIEEFVSPTNLISWAYSELVFRRIVRRNISSALILEDDADWDVRIKEQLRHFALCSRALTQPLSEASLQLSYADSTYPSPSDPSAVPASDISFDNLPTTIPPKSSPYGDHWDFIWVGHCGMHFPFRPGKNIPKGRVIQIDHTVPQQQHLRTLSSPDDLKVQYPNHTRAVHHVQDGVCSLGYAITQATARQLLYSIGLNDVNTAYDILLRQFCEGTGGRKYHNCLTMQPSLFQHHRPAGSKNAESDISDHGEGFREVAVTDVVRWSTRMNWEVLLDGRTDFVDQWPDAE